MSRADTSTSKWTKACTDNECMNKGVNPDTDPVTDFRANPHFVGGVEVPTAAGTTQFRNKGFETSGRQGVLRPSDIRFYTHIFSPMSMA